MIEFEYVKTCQRCGEENSLGVGLDTTQDEGKPFRIDLDFIGHKKFRCENCGIDNYCDELEWYTEDNDDEDNDDEDNEDDE